MVIKVFSVFDVKAQVFGQPFFMAHENIARRAFGDLSQDPQTTISKHPEDYKLYVIGTFDDNSGALVSLPQPEFLANASDFIKV